MTILLDSHALIWFVTDDRRCSASARNAIASEAGAVLVSAASAWEIATKVRLGRWPEAAAIAATLVEVLAVNRMTAFDVSLEHGILAGSLPGSHGDPFDRMLAAQAQVEGIPLVTADPVFHALGVRVLW
jgi:PIN domain nuclease of toxin-antitoxin system